MQVNAATDSLDELDDALFERLASLHRELWLDIRCEELAGRSQVPPRQKKGGGAGVMKVTSSSPSRLVSTGSNPGTS